MRKLLFSCALALCIAPIFAQTAIDPPLTPAEQKMVVQMQQQWKAQGMPALTDEQLAAMVRKMREVRLNMLGVAAGMQLQAQQMQSGHVALPAMALQPAPIASAPVASAPVASAPVASAPVASAPVAPAAVAVQPAPAAVAATQTAGSTPAGSGLQAQIAQRNAANRFTLFAPQGDGFNFDGQPYVDADGRIVKYGADFATGWVTYMAAIGPGHYLIKHQNVHSNLPPVTIGEVAEQDGFVNFRSRDGQTAGGTSILLTSNGVMVERDASLVDFDLTRGMQAVAVPQGFHVARFQHGDVAGTGYMLLERVDADPNNPAHAIKDLGAVVGDLFGAKDQAYDYALYNMSTRALVPLNLSMRGKNVGYGTNCRRQNKFVDKCRGYTQYESIWQPDGRPNLDHYFWALTWQTTKYGPLAVAEENSERDLNVIRLDNGNRYNAFHRGLGLNGFTATPSADGDLHVVATIVFSKKELPDLGALLASTPAAAGAPAGTQ
ncbi:MAG: hypothetical protein JSS44_11960 [Proteobacteria bacterium]|nr:hypothetical protein [Pseudomonadota bacterium]